MKPQKIAVLGDIHGHVTLALGLLKRWELESETALDLILQVGDFGVFPRGPDVATKRFARKDPDELGFLHYMNSTLESKLLLGPESAQRISAPLVFVKGNHEDFEWLERQERGNSAVPTDYFGRIMYLPNGCIHTISDGPVIGGLGGTAKGPPLGTYTAQEARKLKGADIILAHEPYQGGPSRYGSKAMREAVLACQPTYFFCGHFHEPGHELRRAGSTKGFLLNEVNFKQSRTLNPGCIGILNWVSKTEHSFSFLSEPWLAEYTRDNYKERIMSSQDSFNCAR